MADTTDLKLRLLMEVVDKSGRELQGAVQDLRNLSSEAKKTGLATEQAGVKGASGMKKFGDATKEVTERLRKTNELAGQLQSVGLQLGIIGASLSAAAFFPVKSAATFEKSMSGVLAVTKDADILFDQLAQRAKDLGATTRFTAAEAAEGMRFLGMAGLNAAQALDAIGPALDLAAAGELSVAEASDIATNTMSAMRLTVDDLGHVMDVLANTAASSNTDIRQMSEALKYAAPAAAAAGVNIDELGALIGILGSNGIQASMAGTTLRGMLISLSSPSAKAQKALDSLNVQIAKSEDGSVDLTETLYRLRDANFGLAEATAIFNRRAATGALALANNVDWVERLTRANQEADGAAQKMAKTMLDNLYGAFVELRSAVEGFMIAVGEPLLGVLTNVLDAFTSVFRILKTLAEEFPLLTGSMVALVGSLGILATSIGALLLITGSLIKAFTTMKLALIALQGTKLGAWIIGTIVQFKAWIAATITQIGVTTGLTVTLKGLIASFGALSLVMKATVIGVFIAAATAVYKALSAWSAYRKTVQENMEVSKRWGEQKEKLRDALKVEEQSIASLSKQTYDQIKAYQRGVVEKLKFWTAARNEAIMAGKDASEYNEKIDSTIKHLHEVNAVVKQVDAEPLKKFSKEAEVSSTAVRSLSMQIYDQANAYRKGLLAKLKFWTDARDEAIAAGKDASEYNQKINNVIKRLREANEWIKQIDSEPFQEVEEAVEASDEAIKSFEKSAKKAYEEATKNAKKYGEEAVKWEEAIKFARLDTEDKLRELTRKGLSEYEAWTDRKLQAEEKLAKAKKALTEGDFKLAERFVKESERLYGGLATEVKKTTDIFGEEAISLKENLKIASAGVSEAGEVLAQVYTAQRDIARQAQTDSQKAADEIDKALIQLTKDRKADVLIALPNLEQARNALNKLLKTETKKIRIEYEEKKAIGGPVHMLRGGKLPGDSKIDSVPVVARPGEWFIRNEASKFWNKQFGSGFMWGINDPWSNFGKRIQSSLSGAVPKFKFGGSIPNFSPNIPIRRQAGGPIPGFGIKDLGTVELQIGGKGYPVLGETEVIGHLKDALEKEGLMRSN